MVSLPEAWCGVSKIKAEHKVTMEETDPDVKKKPPATTPEVTIKIEPVIIEPEFITVKQELSWCGSVVSDAAIKEEPSPTRPMVTIKIEPITEKELPAIKQESCNEKELPSSPYSDNFREKPDTNSYSAKYECILDDTKFPTTISDKIKKESSQESNIEDDIYKSYSINTHLRKYACDICEKRFRFKDNLYDHRRTHTSKKLICDICMKEFIKKSVLIRHLRVHTHEKPYRCKTCRKKFSQRCSLIRHEQIHTGTKPHLCQICKKHFANASYLKLHVRTHTGEKPYSCDVCKKPFAVAASLKRHKQTHVADDISIPKKIGIKK